MGRFGDRRARRLAVAAAALLGSGPALAACPAAADLDKGVVFTSTDTHTRVTVRRIDGSTTRVDTERDGKAQTSMVYRDGLFPIASAHAKGLTTYGYEPASPRLRLEDGQSVAYTVVTRTPGAADGAMRATISVHGSERITVGDCAYDGRVVERTNRLPDGSSNFVLYVFSPDFSWPLRSRIRFDDGRQQDFTYGSVVPAAETR